MRALILLILLIFSAVSLGGEPMKVKPKMGKQHDRHPGRHYQQDQHKRRDHGAGRAHDERRWGVTINTNPGHQYRPGHARKHHRAPGYRRHPGQGYYRHSVHDYSPRDWTTAFRFTTGSGRHGKQVLHLDARVNAIRLHGRHQDASVSNVYAELGNGRTVLLSDLEGHLAHGEDRGRYLYFDEPRHITRIFLSVSSGHRHQPAHIELDYVEAERGRY